MKSQLGKKPYPNFIKKHLIFKAFPVSDLKIFPKLGLKNSEDKLTLSTSTITAAAVAAFKISAIQMLKTGISRIRGVDRFTYRSSDHYPYRITTDRGFVWLKNKQEILSIVFSLKELITNSPESFIQIKGMKFSYKFPKTIYSKNKKYSFKAGTNFLNTISSFNNILKKNNFIPFSFQEKNIGFNQFKTIVFSSSGEKGLWDISTMSMRGISSCQKWTASHRNCLIGSMTDPYAGIIYLSNNKKTAYGKKMIHRAVVRLVMKSNKPAIMIEKIYPINYDNNSQIAFNTFKTFIQKKIKNKYPIINGDTSERKGYKIPLSEPVTHLKTDHYNDINEKSYRDSKISYTKKIVNIDKYI